MAEAGNMTEQEYVYKKKAGRTFFTLRASTLWLTDDHLLYVQTILTRETYKRFYFSDIQSIIVQYTNTHLIWSCVWGILAFLCGLAVLIGDDVSYAGATFTGIFLTALFINLFMGPSCKVHLRTAVQQQHLACLKRARKTEKVLAHIRSVVEAQQGNWQKEKSVALFETFLEKSRNKTAVNPKAAPVAMNKDNRVQQT